MCGGSAAVSTRKGNQSHTWVSMLLVSDRRKNVFNLSKDLFLFHTNTVATSSADFTKTLINSKPNSFTCHLEMALLATHYWLCP